MLTLDDLFNIITLDPLQYQKWVFSPTEETMYRSTNVLSIYHTKSNRRKLTVSVMGQATKASLEVRNYFFPSLTLP